MKLNGEQLVPAGRQVVWDGLNDPEVLQASVPGCEKVVQKSPTEFEAEVTAKVGPVKAKFTGEIMLSELDPPNSYRITGQGKGGIAGFAKGGAFVKLDEAEGGTLLRYEVDAQVGGKLASLGGRLIDATAKKMAGDFFARFSDHVAPKTSAEESQDMPEKTATAHMSTKGEQGSYGWLWQGAAVVAGVAVLVFLYLRTKGLL